MKKFLYLNEFPSDLQTLKDEICKDLTVGIESWSVWLQMNKIKKYYLHYYQGRSQDLYVDRLLSFQNSEQVLELDFYLPEDLPECTYPYCFFYPLLPDKVEDHREYCRRAMHENREQTTRACQAFGLVHLSKWIQTFNQCYYVLYTQVFNAAHSASPPKLSLPSKRP